MRVVLLVGVLASGLALAHDGAREICLEISRRNTECDSVFFRRCTFTNSTCAQFAGDDVVGSRPCAFDTCCPLIRNFLYDGTIYTMAVEEVWTCSACDQTCPTWCDSECEQCVGAPGPGSCSCTTYSCLDDENSPGREELSARTKGLIAICSSLFAIVFLLYFRSILRLRNEPNTRPQDNNANANNNNNNNNNLAANAQPSPRTTHFIRAVQRLVPMDEREMARHVEGEAECAICLKAFAVGDEAHALPCSHVFHLPCVRSWFLGVQRDGRRAIKRTCPICRSECAWAQAEGGSEAGTGEGEDPEDGAQDDANTGLEMVPLGGGGGGGGERSEEGDGQRQAPEDPEDLEGETGAGNEQQGEAEEQEEEREEEEEHQQQQEEEERQGGEEEEDEGRGAHAA